MKKVFLILLLCCNIAYAGQYVYVGHGYTVNKNNIFYIQKQGKDLFIRGQGKLTWFHLKYSSIEERDRAYTELMRKLEQWEML